jgi:vacuolar-type H+-ATPase subunit I/STV1
MARGQKRGVDSQIAAIDAKIAKKQGEIQALKEKRQELVDANQAALAAKVVKYAADKGITVEELLQSIEQK